MNDDPGQEAAAAEGMHEDVPKPGIQGRFLLPVPDEKDRREGHDLPENKKEKKSPAKTTPRELRCRGKPPRAAHLRAPGDHRARPKSDEHKDQSHDDAQPIYLEESEGIAQEGINPMGSRWREKDQSEPGRE